MRYIAYICHNHRHFTYFIAGHVETRMEIVHFIKDIIDARGGYFDDYIVCKQCDLTPEFEKLINEVRNRRLR